MGKDYALYIGSNHRRQCKIAHELDGLQIKFQREGSIKQAIRRLQVQVQAYVLFLIQFEAESNYIFDFFKLLRFKNPNALVMVLIDKPLNNTEKHLFDCGVDDVVIGDSMHPPILTSRIKRRLFSGRLSWTQTERIMLKGGALIDFARSEVHIHGAIRALTYNSDRLLRYFLRNPERIITKDELWESNIWERAVCRAGNEEEGKAIDMAIGRLRKTIEADPKNPQIIKTVIGKGVMLTRDAVL